MKLIAPLSGQSLQLFIMDEIKPLRGGIFLGDLAPAIMERYRFMEPPESLRRGEPAKFGGGVFRTDRTIPIESLEVYQDGVLVGSTTTDDADLVLDDFITWLTQVFELREPETRISRSYQSAIIAGLDGSLNRFITNFQTVSELLTAAFKAQSALSVTTLTIGPHPPTPYPFQTTWKIEARVGQPFVSNRYVSTAPLATAEHVELLDALERAIGWSGDLGQQPAQPGTPRSE